MQCRFLCFGRADAARTNLVEAVHDIACMPSSPQQLHSSCIIWSYVRADLVGKSRVAESWHNRNTSMHVVWDCTIADVGLKQNGTVVVRCSGDFEKKQVVGKSRACQGL